MNILVTAASRQGSTYAIAEAIGRTLQTRGLDATVAHPNDVVGVDDYDAVVIGSAIYMGRWLDDGVQFVRRLAASLAERPVWLFSSGPVGDPQRKLVQKMTADPLELPELLKLTQAREHRIFAGKLNGSGLSGPRRLSLVVFRSIEGDWRDWAAVEHWAAEIGDGLVADASPLAVAVGKAQA
jgi:menaquinone-dependent protoporphyrinogen oxidase